MMLRGALAVAWLLGTGLAQAPAPDPLAAVLAPFPDDGLPALLAACERPGSVDPTVHTRLAALGPAAHEALLGLLLRPHRVRDPSLVGAFGGFDARAGWALPLLVHERNVIDGSVQQLLLRLGPAATPALPALRALAADRHPTLGGLVDELARASDQPWPARAAPERQKVALEFVPALLERLRAGPAEQRWPALQALLAAGDAAVVAAVVELCRLELEPAQSAAAADLLAVVRGCYGARCRQDHEPLAGLGGAEVVQEGLRQALAGRPWQKAQLREWLQSVEPARRHAALVAMALVVDTTEFGGSLADLPSCEDVPELQQFVDLLARLRRVRGARLGAAWLPQLAVATAEELPALLRQLEGHDLHAAPPALWPLLFELLTRPAGVDAACQPRDEASTKSVERLLYAAARSRGELPLALVAEVPRLGPDSTWQGLRRELLRAAALPVLAACLRTASEDREALARWLACLRAGEVAAAPVLALVGEALANEVTHMPLAAQLDWLEWNRAAPVPVAQWHELLRAGDVAMRQRALSLAFRRVPTPVLAIESLVACLQDDDLQAATMAGWLLARDQQEPERAVAALAARCAAAPLALRGNLLEVLRAVHAKAPQSAAGQRAKAALEALAASTGRTVAPPRARPLTSRHSIRTPAR